MNAELENNRWNVQPSEFAVRVMVSDIKGLLRKSLVIEPGVRAMIVQDGALLGEVGPGEYSMLSLEQTLMFWRKARQSTAILGRMEDVPFRFQLKQLPTAENLLVDVDVQIVIQLADTVPFLHNLMGAQDVVKRDGLQKMLHPLLRRALWNAIGKTSISKLTSSGASELLIGDVDSSLQAWCERYGLNFVDLRLMSARHEKFDAMKRKAGEIELIKAGVAQKAKLDTLYSENELRKIQRKENLNELRVLAANVETDGMESRLAARIQRIEVEDRIRETLNDEQFSKISSREDLKNRLLEIDQQKVLRREQLDELLEQYERNKEDRGLARTHFLKTLDLQRGSELTELRQEIDQASELRYIDHQIVLADKAATIKSGKWKLKLQQRREEADWQDERKERQTAQQLDRLAKVQELNYTDAERKQRLASEMADGDHRRQLEKMQTMDGLKSETLIASANVDNAALLADLKKQEAMGLSDAERKEMYERLSEAERLKADAIGDAYRKATEMMQSNTASVVNAVTRPNNPTANVPPPPNSIAAEWFVSAEGQATGPYGAEEIQRRIRAGEIRRTTLMWREGIEWTSVGMLAEFSNSFSSPPPPPG